MAGNSSLTNIVSSSGDPLIDGVLSGVSWKFTNLSVAFPVSAAAYGSGYTSEPQNFQEFSEAQFNVASYALNLISDYANITFVAGTDADANLRFANTSGDSTHSYHPDGNIEMGDVWISDDTPGQYDPVPGDFAFATILHEIGHALGLKHGSGIGINDDGTPAQNAGGADIPNFGALPAKYDNWNYTVMTYRSYQGATTDPIQGHTDGQNPTSYGIADIAALQYLYGANYAGVSSTDSVYSWDAAGNKYVNGVNYNLLQPGGTVFETIWDGGGFDTYDFSAFSGNQFISLEPGAYSTFDTSKLADLDQNTAGVQAALGNVANALMYDNNPASLIERAIAGSGNDIMYGNLADNVLEGRDGDDNIYGQDGNDTLYGGAGNDRILGGNGDDLLIGGLGDDRLNGGAGNDTVSYADVAHGSVIVDIEFSMTATGARGNDSLLGIENAIGGGGNDGLFGNGFANHFEGGNGNDVLRGRNGGDELYGGEGNDRLYGDGGDDFLVGGPGDDFIDGGWHTDTVSYADVLSGSVVINMIMHVVTGAAGTDTIVNIENAIGGAGDDALFGNSADNWFDGGDGDDVLRGQRGNDRLDGGAGNDRLYGNEHDDVLNGGTGNDLLTGGTGNDEFVYGANGGDDVIADFVAGAGSEDFVHFTGVGLASYADVLAAAAQVGADTLITVAGHGTLTLAGVNLSSLHSDDFIFS